MLPLHFQYFMLFALAAVQCAVHGTDEVTKTIDYWLPPPGMYAHQVWHEQQQQQQQEEQAEQEAQQSELPRAAPMQEKREKHDIYLNYETPKRLSYGHVEANPEHIEQRFSTRDEGNRYKGMVIWADRKGGYGEHRWDLVQGAI